MHRRDVQALSRGARFEAACLEGSSARVVSVHNTVVNIETGDELVLLPTELCISRESIRIDLRQVPRWRGLLPCDTRATLSYSCYTAFAEAVRVLAIESPVRPDCPLMPQTVHRWIGLGPGLTPAGDDILLGYLAVDNHLGQDPAQTQALHASVAQALGQTTRLSAQLLRNALAHDYHESVQRVLAILCGVRNENLLAALRCLHQIGASSGESTIYGMWLALGQLAYQDAATVVGCTL